MSAHKTDEGRGAHEGDAIRPPRRRSESRKFGADCAEADLAGRVPPVALGRARLLACLLQLWWCFGWRPVLPGEELFVLLCEWPAPRKGAS